MISISLCVFIDKPLSILKLIPVLIIKTLLILHYFFLYSIIMSYSTKITTNTARNTPRNSCDMKAYIPTNLEEKLEYMERKLEKAEHFLRITEQMNKLRQELDEIRHSDLLRKVEDLDKRVVRLEQSIGQTVIEMDFKIEEQKLKISEFGEVSNIRTELEELKNSLISVNPFDDFEKVFSQKLSEVCRDIENLSRESNKNSANLEELYGRIRDRSPSFKEIENLLPQLFTPAARDKLQSSVEEEEEDLFLRALEK